MYTSTATMQSKISNGRGSPILQIELNVNMGDCYKHLKHINSPKFFNGNKMRKEGFM